MAPITEIDLKNRILKILKRKGNNKGKSTAEIYLTLTAEELREALLCAKSDYISDVEHYFGGLEQAISALLRGCQLHKLTPLPEYKDGEFQRRARALNHPTLTEREFNQIATLFKIADPDWKFEDKSVITSAPQPINGRYDDNKLVNYLTGANLNQFKDSLSIKLIRQIGTDKVPAGSDEKEAVQLLTSQLAEYQHLLIKLYFGTLENYTLSLIERTSNQVLQRLVNKDEMKRYIIDYIIPQFPQYWPTYIVFLNCWKPPKNHPLALTIGERIYRYFGEMALRQSSTSPYKYREKALWRKVGEDLGLQVESSSRRALSKDDLDEQLKTIFKMYGALSQHLLRKINSGLGHWIVKHYKGYTKMQVAITGVARNAHVADDGKVLDSLAEKCLYNHLISIQPHTDWLQSIEPHQVYESPTIVGTKNFRVDFILNSNVIIEVEMVDSTREYTNSIHKSYVKRNTEKRDWFTKNKIRHIFLQQEECFSEPALLATVQKLKTLIESPNNETPEKLVYQSDKLGLNFWRQPKIVQKELEKAKIIALADKPERLTLNEVFKADGKKGLRDAFYRLHKTTRQSWIKDIEHLLIQTPQFIDGKLSESAWTALQEQLRNSRGILMSDQLYDKLGFTSSHNFSVMLTVTRHFSDLKDLAIHFELGWLPNTKAICFELSTVRIRNNDVKGTIESLPPLSDEKLHRLKTYFTSEDRKPVRKVRNSYCYEDGEMFDSVKQFIAKLIRKDDFYPLRKKNEQLYQHICGTIKTAKFYKEIGYRIGMAGKDWVAPVIWPKLRGPDKH